MAETKKFGRYVVRDTIGRGAMGVVYLAEDPVIGRKLAIKVVEGHVGLDKDELAQLQARFEREFQSAGQLSHPNIVSVHDVGQQDGDSFIAMEFVQGESLHSVLAEGRVFSFKEIADMAAQIGSALDFAHEKGIVHRDIKPANIMITRDGRPKITDFGVAKVATTTLTRTGTVVGTPAYMSPEQVTGHPVSGAADQFSLAVMLYQMITGERPFTGENPTTIMYKIVHEEPVRPSALNVAVPAPVDAALIRALSKSPDARYPTCTDLADALRAALGAAPAEATMVMTSQTEATVVDASLARPAAPPRTARSGPPTGVLAAAGAAILVLALGLGAWRAGVFGGAPPAGPEDAPPPVTHTLTVDAAGGWDIWVNGAASGISTPGAVELTGVEGDEIKVDLRHDGRLLASETFVLGSDIPAVWIPPGMEASAGLTGAVSDPGADAGASGEPAVPEEPAAELVTFTIVSTPPGARVTFDGERLADPTPVDVEIDLSTAHSVKVEADGYEPAGWQFEREDLNGEQLGSHRLDFPLTSSVPPGFLVIDNPSYAVEVRAMPRGGGAAISSGAATHHRLRLMPGSYRVTLSAPSIFWSETRDVTVESEGSRAERLPGVVAVRFNADPGNCKISINGREVGAPPFTQNLAIGYEYTFKFDWSAIDRGEKEWSQRVNSNTQLIAEKAPRVAEQVGVPGPRRGSGQDE